MDRVDLSGAVVREISKITIGLKILISSLNILPVLPSQHFPSSLSSLFYSVSEQIFKIPRRKVVVIQRWISGTIFWAPFTINRQISAGYSLGEQKGRDQHCHWSQIKYKIVSSQTVWNFSAETVCYKKEVVNPVNLSGDMSEFQQLMQDFIPSARDVLQENYSNLLKVADYCDSNYEQVSYSGREVKDRLAWASIERNSGAEALLYLG